MSILPFDLEHMILLLQTIVSKGWTIFDIKHYIGQFVMLQNTSTKLKGNQKKRQCRKSVEILLTKASVAFQNIIKGYIQLKKNNQ